MHFIWPAIFIFYFGSSFCTTSEKIQRKSFEAGFNAYEASGLLFQNYDRARLYLSKIIDDSEQAGYWDITLRALSLLSYISDKNFQYGVMKEAVENGQRIMREKSAFLDSLDQNYVIRVDMVVMIGTFYIKNSEIENAAGVFQSLVQRLNKITMPDKSAVFKTYAYIADLYMDLGLYEKVYAYYMLMEKSIPDGAEQSLFSYLYTQYLGTYYYRTKNYPLAKSYLIAALKKINIRSVTDEWKNYIISNYDLLALIYQSLNQSDSAMVYLKRSLAMLPPDDLRIIEPYENYGDCLFKSKDFAGALTYYQKIYTIVNREKQFNAYKKAQILSKIGDAYQNQGNFRKALNTIQQAFATLYKDSSFLKNQAINPEMQIIQPDKIVIRLLIIKSNALAELARTGDDKKNRLLSSLSTFRLASLIVDEFRHLISTDDFKEFFVTDIREMYDNAIKASFSVYEITRSDSIIELALYFMEKSKNQVLLDAIKASHAIKFSGIPDSLIDFENQFKNRIVLLQNKLYRLRFENADIQLLTACQYELANTQNDYGNFLKELEIKYPGYYSLKYYNKVPGIQDIMQLVKNNALIEYMVGENFIMIIAFSRGKSVFRLLPRDAAFDRELNGLLHDLGKSNLEENRSDPKVFERFVEQAGSLYSILLKPALDEFNKIEQIIIIPDGKLCYLPFEVLIDKLPGNFHAVDYAGLNYVLKNYIIRYEFSSELLFENRDARNKTKRSNTYTGFAPDYYQKEGLRKVNVLGKSTSAFLTPLKFSSREIEAASAIFKGTAYLGENANVKTFKDHLVSSKIIHFAGHTIINDSIPELSGIFFSDTDDNPLTKTGLKDDVIYINDFFSLEMNAGLVILSACETGSGKLMRGEGLISIGRAFIYAGCPNLIMSLWKINDRSASSIITRFCQNLKKGQRKDVALRNAKIDYLNNIDAFGYGHPYYWSAFIMIGNSDSLFYKKKITLAISGLIILAFSILVGCRIRKKNLLG